jgi:hypothetical protein
MRHNVSKQIVSDSGDDQVSKDVAISQYQPALASSFNGGLGTPSAWQVLQLAIRQVSENNLSAYDRKAAQMELRQFVNDKDRDPFLRTLREQLKNRMEEIAGFDRNSDKDRQFGDLNELAVFLIKARSQLNKVKLNPRKLVDAFLVYVFKEKAKTVIERPEKHLQCPRCHKTRSFCLDKDPRFYLCLGRSCGKRIPIQDARFKVTQHKIDGRYLRTIENLFRLSTAPVSTSSEATVEMKA